MCLVGDPVIDYDGPKPDPRWQWELDTIAPPGGRLSSFRIVWESGDVWDKVGRWMVMQMIPPERIPDFIRDWLEGPNPRSMGRFDRVRGEFISRAPPISRRQWVLFRETGCYARPYWVVQGTKGGHKYLYDKIESRLSFLEGGPRQPPRPGELAYAEPDRRTFERIAETDLLRKFKKMIDFLEHSEERISERERNALQDMKQKVWDWLGGQIEEPGDRMASHLLRTQGSHPDTPPPIARIDEKLERFEEDFVTSDI